MSKLKILHVIKSLGRGGAEVLLPATLKLHDQNLFDFHYIYFLPWKDQVVEPIREAGGKVTCISAKNNFEMLRKYPEVITYCNENDIDLIHCHLPWSGFLGRIIYRKTSLPVLYTEHNIQERYHFVTKWLNKSTFNNQSLAIGVSEDVTQSIKQNIHPSIPVETVLNGVNTRHFKRDVHEGLKIRKQLGIPDGAIVVGNIAVFRKQKGLLTWVKAFKEVHDNNPETYGVLVGAGPEEEKIKALVEEHQLTSFIKFPGLQKITIPYFSALDIFLMSSEFEGLPIALLEAMSMKCSVVATKAGGVVEVIRDGVDGFLCETEDHNALAERVNFLITKKEQRELFAEAARDRVKEKFSLEHMVTTLERTYTKYSENDNRRS